MILSDGSEPLLNKQYIVSIILTLCLLPAFEKHFTFPVHVYFIQGASNQVHLITDKQLMTYNFNHSTRN